MPPTESALATRPSLPVGSPRREGGRWRCGPRPGGTRRTAARARAAQQCCTVLANALLPRWGARRDHQPSTAASVPAAQEASESLPDDVSMPNKKHRIIQAFLELYNACTEAVSKRLHGAELLPNKTTKLTKAIATNSKRVYQSLNERILNTSLPYIAECKITTSNIHLQ